MGALDRQRWIHVALDELIEGGVEAVRVEVLARRLGVTKGSFYWHFGGRRDLLDALLTWFEQVGTDHVIEEVDASAADPRGRLHALAGICFASSTLADQGEPALRAWASTDERAAQTLARVDARRLSYVTELLVADGQEPTVARRRADLFYRLLIGDFVWRAHGGEPLDVAAQEEVVRLMLGEELR